MQADVALEGVTVHVLGDLMAVDGRLLIEGDALVARFDSKDHRIPVRMLFALCEMAAAGKLWNESALSFELRAVLQLPPIKKLEGGVPDLPIDGYDQIDALKPGGVDADTPHLP